MICRQFTLNVDLKEIYNQKTGAPFFFLSPPMMIVLALANTTNLLAPV